MSLYSDLTQVLTPYADKIKKIIKTKRDIRSEMGVISFWGNDYKSNAAIYGLNVDRTDGVLSFNGTGISTTARFKLTGDFSYTSTLATAMAWDKELTLPAGKYYISFQIKEGSTTVESVPFIRGYDSENNMVFEIKCGEYLELDYTGGNLLIFLTSSTNGVFNNISYKVDIYNISASPLIEKTKRALINPVWFENGLIHKDNGAIVEQSSAAWKYTQYYKIPDNSKSVSLSVYAGGNSVGVAFYNSVADFLGGVQSSSYKNTDLKTFPIPSTAKYIRFCNNTGTSYHLDLPLIYFNVDKSSEVVSDKKYFSWKRGLKYNNAESNSNYRMHNIEPIHITKPCRIEFATGWRGFVSYWSNGQWIKDGTTKRYATIADSGYDIYINMRKDDFDNTTISELELASASENIAVILTDEYEEKRRAEQYAPDWTALSMFYKIGVLGDSFSSGSLHPVDGSAAISNYSLSWGQMLARDIGATVTNYSKGGLSVSTWLTNAEWGLPKLLASEPEQLYICAFGINDWNQRETYPIGTVADCKSDYTQNPSSFYGNYGKAIGNIIDHAPNAKIVLLSVMRENERKLDADIKEIAEHFELPFIQLTDDDFFVSEFYAGSINGNHPLAYGYAGITNAIKRLLLKCIVNNTDYFNTYYG